MLNVDKEMRELEKRKFIEQTRKETQTPLEKLKEKLANKRKKNDKVRKTTLDILPYKGFVNERENFIELNNDNGFMEILSLQGYNLNGINQDALTDIVFSYRDLIKMYVFPFKVVSLHTPLDTAPQQRYYQSLAKITTNTIHQQLLMENYYEMKWFSENELNREFFVFIYAETLAELIEYRSDFLQYSGGLKVLPITKYKKTSVLFRLNNPLSQILF